MTPLATAIPLAQRMGTTTHISPLFQKLRRWGIQPGGDLEKIATSRGLSYYQCTLAPQNSGSLMTPKTSQEISNEELAIALMSPSAPYSLNRLRLAGAILGADGVSAKKIIHLAMQERCESIVRHIAECALQVEPDNLFWHQLVEHLPHTRPLHPDTLPHLTRFVSMTGLSRAGKGNVMQWIRPTTATPAIHQS